MTTIFNIINACGTVATAVVAFFGFVLAIWQYGKESIRKKRSETLAAYSALFSEAFALRDEYIADFKEEDLFALKVLQSEEHTALCNKVLNLLTHFESFAKGLEYNIYDFRIFIYLTPQEMFEILNVLTQFVYEERKKKGYDLLFDDFIALVSYTSLCMQNKLNHKKFSPKYKRVKV